MMQENGGLAFFEDLEPFPRVGLLVLVHIIKDGHVISSRVFQLLLRAVSKTRVGPGNSIHFIKHTEKGSFLEIMTSRNDEKSKRTWKRERARAAEAGTGRE